MPVHRVGRHGLPAVRVSSTLSSIIDCTPVPVHAKKKEKRKKSSLIGLEASRSVAPKYAADHTLALSHLFSLPMPPPNFNVRAASSFTRGADHGDTRRGSGLHTRTHFCVLCNLPCATACAPSRYEQNWWASAIGGCWCCASSVGLGLMCARGQVRCHRRSCQPLSAVSCSQRVDSQHAPARKGAPARTDARATAKGVK